MRDSKPNLAEGLIPDIVEVMQSEVDQLVQHKNALVVQIRRLKKTLIVLREMQDEVTGRANTRRRQRSQRLRYLQMGRRLRLSRNPYGELTRACRIAFTEAGGIATPNEIRLSILRRRSFVFASLNQDPVEAVVRILNVMANAKEVRRLTDDQYSRWQFLGSRYGERA